MAVFDSRESARSRLGQLLALFGLLMVRNCSFGVRYWPQLDDYIQYHNYAAQFTFSQLEQTVGVLAQRPLAGLADYFVWSPLFERMIVGVAAVTGLYVVCVGLSIRLAERYVSVGPIFPVVMALLPLGVEGTYWMSAATRIVPGLFFALIAALAFGRWLDDGRWGWALAFLGLMLLPFGYYEQAAVLAMTLVLGMAMLQWRGRWRRGLLALWTVPVTALYITVARLISVGGAYGARASLMLPGQTGYWAEFLPNILGQIKAVFIQGGIYILAKGFVRGLLALVTHRMLLCAVLLAALSVLYSRLSNRETVPFDGSRRSGLALFAGLIMTLAPLTPFLILENPWFSVRGALTSFPGIALMCDAGIMALWPRKLLRRKGPAIAAACLAFVFGVAGISEIGDYKATWENDQHVARVALAVLEEDGLISQSGQGLRVGFLGVEASALTQQNFYWHEHIHGCTESGWAFTGLLVSMAPGGQLPSVTPLPSNPIYRLWNARTNRPDTFDVLYVYRDGQMIRAVLEHAGEDEFLVAGPSGETLGAIRVQGGAGYFSPLGENERQFDG